MNNKTTIIIVNYNSFDLLENCLDSIQKYILNEFVEVIVVDNASTIGDVSETVARFDFVKLIQNKINLGFARANNQALELVKSEYVLFLNNDTVFIENTINKIISSNLNFSRMLIGVKLHFPNGTFQESAFRFLSIPRLFAANFFLDKLFKNSGVLGKRYTNLDMSTSIQDVDYILGAFIFGKTDFIKELHGFDERLFFYHEDSDLCLRAKNSGGRVIYFPFSEVIHVSGGTTDHMLKFKTVRKHIARIQYFQKHFHNFEFIFALIIEYLGVALRIPLFLFVGIFTLNTILLKRSLYHLELLFTYPKNEFK